MAKIMHFILLLSLLAVINITIASPTLSPFDKPIQTLVRRNEDPILSQTKQSMERIKSIESPGGRQQFAISMDPILGTAIFKIIDEMNRISERLFTSNELMMWYRSHSLYTHANSIYLSCVGSDRDLRNCVREYASLAVDLFNSAMCITVNLARKDKVSNYACAAATFYLASIIKYAMLHQVPFRGVMGGTFDTLSEGVVSMDYAKTYKGMRIVKDKFIDVVHRINYAEEVRPEDMRASLYIKDELRL
ncbi:hypothetical protein BKA69DRAFT_1128287 [Paraphysoderma sedebokerense]|nr:hypothetical protein BKA69DRAFT_1128287 [Paraphysoderma sedebokerense]